MWDSIRGWQLRTVAVLMVNLLLWFTSSAGLGWLLQVGKKNRVVGATMMNQESSRSHSIFTITIEATDRFNPADTGVQQLTGAAISPAWSDPLPGVCLTSQQMAECPHVLVVPHGKAAVWQQLLAAA
jgi:hypothetical protein